MEKTSNKTIAKNTLFLYFRMALVTVVGLYTSRVILLYLGVEDFGIYNVAGSVVALFGFLTGALGNSSSRFITVEIGKVNNGDISKLIDCFKTTRLIHAVLALLITIFAETVGLWMLYTKCNIPTDRMPAAMWVYQMSVVTSCFTITQIPFTALIIAHERMSIYAYVSIFEVIAKLTIVYLLIISPVDKLVFYAVLLLTIQIIILSFYRIYCKRKFNECQLGYGYSAEFFKPLMSFSFWNLFGSISYSALTQGATILISMFFSPSIVAARAVANQVKNHVNNFVNNFRMAINPQILKRHAAGDIDGSRELLFFSCNLSFCLMLAMVLPLLFETRFVLNLWLHDVPDYTVEFLQIVLVEMLVYVYDVSFYQIFQAEGRLKENAVICPLMDIIALAIIYMLYLRGASVLWIAWGMLFLTILQGMLVKPWLAVRLFGYKWIDFLKVYIINITVAFTSAIIPAILVVYDNSSMFFNLALIAITVISVSISSYCIGLRKEDRKKINTIITRRLKNINLKSFRISERPLMEKQDTYALRGICMIMIMVHHVYKYLVADYCFSSNMIDRFWGDLGTGVFFFVSGYGLYCSCSKNCEFPQTMIKNLRKLFIPFVVVNIIAFILLLLIEGGDQINEMLLNISTLGLPQGGAWFFKAITCIYIITIGLFSFKVTDNIKVLILFLLNFIYITIAVRALDFDAYLFATTINFPLGMLLALNKKKGMNTYLIIALLALLFVFAMHLNIKTSLSIKSSVFSFLAIYSCSILPVYNKFFYYIGKNSLLFYLFHIALLDPILMLVNNKMASSTFLFVFTFVCVFAYNKVEAIITKIKNSK